MSVTNMEKDELYQNSNPFYLLAEDMVKDALQNVRGLHRKTDRALTKKWFIITSQAIGSAKENMQLAYGVNAPVQLTLLNELAEEKNIDDRVRAAATFAGDTALYEVKSWGELGRRYGFYNEVYKLPDNGGKISPNDWVNEIWVPDYTERFMGAVSLQGVIAPSETEVA